MSEDKVYKDGDVVWVKLGNSWWPGEVIGDEKRLPDDVHHFKKRPYCVVKFFQEDAYEYPKTAKQIYPFQCSKKDEFIKKGFALYNAKKSFMEKFPDDVKHAESLTTTTTTTSTRIISDRPGGLVKEMWGHGPIRRSKDYHENSHMNTSSNGTTDTELHTTSRRDSVTTILNITPNRASISSSESTPQSTSATAARTISTSSSASVTPNIVTSSQYRCNMCNFTTMRQNVLIMHRKSHSNGGTPANKSIKTPTTQSRASLNDSSLQISDEILSDTTKPVTKYESSSTITPLTTKRPEKIAAATIDTDTDEKKKVKSAATQLKSSIKSQKKASVSPSPKASASKRTLRNSRAAAPLASSTIVSPTVYVETDETVADVAIRKMETDITHAIDNETTNKPEQTGGTVSPTDSKNSEQIRQRLLADWSDEEKDENHSDDTPTTSRKNKSSNSLQLSPTNVSSGLKRNSPTIVPMKTLEGAGQTLVVAASTQSSIVQEIITRTAQRIRNIPKKDRLRDFGNAVPTENEQPKIGEVSADETSVVASSTLEKTTEKSIPTSDALCVSEVAPVSCITSAPSTTLSCFDFQEDEEDHENDVLKSIANYKKKYFSPDKEKPAQSFPINDHTQSKNVCAAEQRDKELSAEIDSLLEQTVTATQTLKEDTIASASVKGLPIKERGKRIFKSRNRARIDDDDVQTVNLSTKPTEVLDDNISDKVEEIKQETSISAAISPSISERRTRGTNRRTRGKVDSKEHNVTTSPVNGNSEKDKTTESLVSESPMATDPVQSVGGMVYVTQSSRRKPYNHRIMRQLIEEDETSIPFIRHSPVEIYSCDSSLDNGTHVVRGRRSKTTTPNSLTALRDENVNGAGSRASSRNMIAAPLTPTDDTSSLGVSDAGAEFGSPASSLDEERLLTPVYDTDNQHNNEFEPINESRSFHELPVKSNDNVEEDEEIESPAHEALSGNELEDHELKEGTKRLKLPKKKLNAKEQQQHETTTTAAEMRKSRAGTSSPNGSDLPKRLTRGSKAQHKEVHELERQHKEVHELERSIAPRARSLRGSPANLELKEKAMESRATSTRATNRPEAKDKTAADLISATSKSPSEEVLSSEHEPTTCLTVVEKVIAEENVSSLNRVKVESPVEKLIASRDSKKSTSQQRKLKTSISNMPVAEGETDQISVEAKLETDTNKPTQKSTVSTENRELLSSSVDPKADHEKLENNKTIKLESNKTVEQDLSLQTPSVSAALTPENTVSATLVEEQLEDKTKAKDYEEDTNKDKAPSRKRRSSSNEASKRFSPREKSLRTNSPYLPVKKSHRTGSPQSSDKKSTRTNFSTCFDKKSSQPNSPLSADKESDNTDNTKSADKQSSSIDSPQRANKQSSRVDCPLSADKQSSSTDSPHNPDNRLSSLDALKTPNKKPLLVVSPHSEDENSARIKSKYSQAQILLCTDSQQGVDKNSSLKTSPRSPDKKLARTESPHSVDKSHSPTHPPQGSDKKLLHTNSPHSEDKSCSLTDFPHSEAKKYTRWDSPHTLDRKNLGADLPTSLDEKPLRIDNLQIPEKKFTRWDSPRSSTESSCSPAKKYSRWDSMSQKKKLEQTNSATKAAIKSDNDELKTFAIDHCTQKEAAGKDSLPQKEKLNTKSPTRNSLNVTEDEGKSAINTTSLSSSPMLKHIPEDASATTTASTASVITSPTVEKVRINVDVANPLSTQIANILAASGNSLHSQQQLQLTNRNKSPKLNTNSPLNRKRSFEESSIVGATETDGDAVVAHVQSLCPQVKITRKERIITPTTVESVISSSPKKSAITQNISSHYDISQMPIVIGNDPISAPKKPHRNSTSSVSGLSASNLWQTDLLQPPTTSTTYIPASDNPYSHGAYPAEQTKITSSPTQSLASEHSHTTISGRPSLSSRSSQSPSPQKSPAASTGGRKQAGNTVTIPSSITVKQHQHKFAEALALADSILGPCTKPTKRRNSQTAPTSSAITGNVSSNRRLNSAPALDVRSTPPAKILKTTTDPEQSKSSSVQVQPDSSSVGKTLSQSHRQTPKQKKLESPSEMMVEPVTEATPLPKDPPSPTKVGNTEENESVTDVEQLNNTAKITAVPIQPIPGYAETFLLCMLVDNLYKPINNIPHYLNTDLNQLVPVPPEAYEGMLPELAVDQPPASSTDNEALTESSALSGSQMNASNRQQEMHSTLNKSQSLMTTRELGESTTSIDANTSDENGFKLVLQQGESVLEDPTIAVDPDVSDGQIENATDNAVVLNLENQQIILDAATFEQLLANPDANTQLVTDDGTEFVLTREVLTALKAQQDGQNVELLAIPAEQQLQEQLLAQGGITEAGSSADLLSVALANSEYYGNDVLQIETTLGAGAGAAGLQLLASDGSIVFQAPPLPQAHLTPPITAHTSETNAVLNQTPIMSTLEKPSTAVVVGTKLGIESSSNAVECDMSGMRPNLDDSLAVIGVTTQTSTVPTSLELPITITNPAIAPKVTMAQSALGAELVQFQPHRSVATATAAAVAAAASVAHIFDDPIEGIN